MGIETELVGWLNSGPFEGRVVVVMASEGFGEPMADWE